MSVAPVSSHGAFLADRSGLAADLVRARDWSAHPLGDPAAWPVELRVALRLLLNAPIAMYLVWGAERTFFFNDAYVPILAERLPGAMGARLEELWADAWPAVRRSFVRAEAGEAVRHENLPITLRRGGAAQETWWTFTFAPLDDAGGTTRGVMCVTAETTAQVLAARAAADTEERSRQIIDSATDFAMIALDLDGVVTRWNDGARRIFGWTEDEMRGHGLDRCVDPADVAQGVLARDRAVALDRGSCAQEGWRSRRDGARFWAAGQLTPIRDAAGEAIGFVEILRDRTEERLAAERLADSEARLAAALDELRVANATLASGMAATVAERDRMWEMAPDLLHVCSAQGVLLRVNPAWTRILGYDAAALVGTRAADLLHPDDVPAFERALAAIAAPAVPADPQAAPLGGARENRVRHRDGSYRWFSWVSVAAPADGMIYAAGRNVTDDREREAKLRDTREFARLALGAIGGVGVWTYDMRADRYYCDAAIAELYAIDPVAGALGVDRATFLGNVHPEDRARLDGVIDRGARTAGDLELEYRIVHPGGALRWVISRGHTQVGRDGQPARRTGIGVDVTHQREIEEQLRQSQKVEAVGQLTGGVAHDFNNLLTVIRGSVDLLRRPDVPEARRTRYIDAISDTTDRATKLTSQLLAFARRQALRPVTFDVRENIAAIREMIGTLIGSRVALVVELADHPCLVDADRSQFDTALVNMVVNARDAMAGEGTLTIRVATVDAMPTVSAHRTLPGAFVAVSLVDTGAGIAPDQIERIFEPFFTTKGVGLGTGLGLSQVFGFARQSGGDVIAQSPPGGGATFTLYLPHVAGAPPVVDPVADRIGAGSGAGVCVLVVEDNPDVGRFATDALAELGYDTHFAADADAALAILATHDGIDLVFSDVVMPGMSGIELGLEVRRRYPSIPVILTSGYSTVLAQSGTHGFDLVHKPYSIDALSLALRKVVDHRPG